jgi:hypothetical protein
VVELVEEVAVGLREKGSAQLERGKRKKAHSVDFNTISTGLERPLRCVDKVLLSGSDLLDGQSMRNLERLGRKTSPRVRSVGDGDVRGRDGEDAGCRRVRVSSLMPELEEEETLLLVDGVDDLPPALNLFVVEKTGNARAAGGNERDGTATSSESQYG